MVFGIVVDLRSMRQRIGDLGQTQLSIVAKAGRLALRVQALRGILVCIVADLCAVPQRIGAFDGVA